MYKGIEYLILVLEIVFNFSSLSNGLLRGRHNVQSISSQDSNIEISKISEDDQYRVPRGRLFKRHSRPPFIVLPPDNSLPGYNKDIAPIVQIRPTRFTPYHLTREQPKKLAPGAQKPININIVMPTARAHAQTASQGGLETKQNTTTIDVNLNLGGNEPKEEKQPIIIQVSPTRQLNPVSQEISGRLPGLNNQMSFPGNGYPAIGNTGSNNMAGMTTGINGNINSGINSNYQEVPGGYASPQLIQQVSNVISDAIRSSLAMSQPGIIAAALQRLATQTQNQYHPEQLISNGLTQAVTQTVAQNSEISQDQKLIHLLASALNILRNGGTGTGITQTPGALNPTSAPLKVELVNLPSLPQQSGQVVPISPTMVQSPSPVGPPAYYFVDSNIRYLTANRLGKALAKALVNTAKRIVSGFQRDKIWKLKKVKKLSDRLIRFLRRYLFKSKGSKKVGRDMRNRIKPFRKTHLRSRKCRKGTCKRT